MSLAQIQAETLDDSVKRIVIADQFADDFLMVMLNDFPTYRELMEEAEGENIPSLSDKLRDEWDRLAEQIVELVEENISPIASELIGQMLRNQGSLPFDLIAKEILIKKEEEIA